jgi:hypothetical protein
VFGALRRGDKVCPQQKRKGKEQATLTMKGFMSTIKMMMDIDNFEP